MITSVMARPIEKDIVVEERIDRYGTKHQVVITNCDRCGGYGGSSAWKYTGVTCFKCGGEGRMQAKNKIYTAEREEQLRIQREKRAEKKRQEEIARAEEDNKSRLAEWKYDNEKIFLVLGNTYEIKDMLRDAGAKFNTQVNGWYFNEKPSQWDTLELETSELIQYNSLGQVERKSYGDVANYVKSQKKLLTPESKWVGEIGDKIEMEFTVLSGFWVETFYGSTCINKLTDEQGNIFVWKTTSHNLEGFTDDNGKVALRGTIKDHGEYREEKQTVLTRCRVVKSKGK